MTVGSLVFSVLILLLFALLMLWNCSKRPKSDLSRECCLQNMNALRGLFAFEIVVGHVIRWDKTILYPLGKFMICSVAFFFFVSALGMVISFEKKKDYLSFRFILSKPVYLFALSIVIFIISMTVDAIFPGDLAYLTPPLIHTYLVKTNWYIWRLIIFYLLFFLVYKYIPRFRVLIIFAVSLLMDIFFYQTGFIEGWYASSIGFAAGLLCGEYFPKIKALFYSWKGILILLVSSIFGFTSLFVSTENVLSMVFMRNSICVAAIIVVFYVCNYFSLCDNFISRCLCKYSTEIYLVQFMWLRVSESYGWNYMIRMVFVVIMTFATALIFHPIVVGIRKILK